MGLVAQMAGPPALLFENMNVVQVDVAVAKLSKARAGFRHSEIFVMKAGTVLMNKPFVDMDKKTLDQCISVWAHRFGGLAPVHMSEVTASMLDQKQYAIFIQRNKKSFRFSIFPTQETIDLIEADMDVEVIH